MMMHHQPFSSSSSYSLFSPFFQVKSKSFQIFTTYRHTPSFLLINKHLTFPLIIHHYPSSPCSSLHLSTTNTSHSTSFAVSYLINNFDLSPQFASKLCSTYKVSFKTSQNPDLVLNFFRNNGFSDTQLCCMIPRAPWLLTCNPYKRVVPKFEFFLSKGASKSDIVNLVSKYPKVLSPNLENHIIPTYELLYRFMQSDKKTIDLVIHNPYLLSYHSVSYNIIMLVDIGVRDSTIARLLQRPNCYKVFRTKQMLKMAEDSPSKIYFEMAMLARYYKPAWEEKVDLYKKWGWSNEDIEEAFIKQPNCMFKSIHKINSVMNFWVNQLGWDAHTIAKTPDILSLSLEKTIIPRAPVVQFLLESGGLQKENASLTYPFLVPKQKFRDVYLNRYKEESYLLKPYDEKLNLENTTDKIGMP